MSTRASRRRRAAAAALTAACFSSMSDVYAVNQVQMVGQRLVRMNYASDGVSYGGTYDYQVFNVLPGAPPVGFLNVVSDFNLNGMITPNEWIVQNVPMPLTTSLTSYPMLSVWWDPGSFNLAPGQPYPTRASIEANKIVTSVPTPDPSWANTNAPTGLSIWGDTDPRGQLDAPVLTTPNSTTVALQAKKIAGVPDIAQMTNECGPTSAANSLRSLESQYPFEMGGKLPASNDDLIKELMKAMKGSDARPFPGLVDNELYDGKKKYAKDKGLPIVVKGGNGSAAASGAKAFDFIKQEIDAGEDVELLVFWPGGGGHWVTVTGYGVDGAKKTLEVNDPDDKKTGAVDWTVDAAGNVTAPKGCTVGWAVSESVTPLWDWVPPSLGGGAWASAGNWSGPSPGFPNSFADIANFGDGSPGAVGPVLLDGSRTVNTIYIGHSAGGSYVITPSPSFPTAALMLNDGYGSGSILHGSPTTDFIQAPVVAADQVYVGVYDPDGKLHFGNTISARSLDIHGPGTTYLDGTIGSPSSRTLDVDIHDGNTVMTAPQYLRNVVLRSGGITIATPVVQIEILSLNLQSIQPFKVNLDDNHLILHNTPVGSLLGGSYTGTTGYIASGRNGGAWNGKGIVTTQTDATTSSLTGIGVATASQVKGIAATATAIWAGHTVTGSDTLVMYTYGGDNNLDGKLNIDDYGHIDSSVAIGLAGWFNGDNNLDGKINVDDYGIIDFNIGIQGPPFLAGGGDVGAGAVPEPVTLIWLAPLPLFLRRRKAARPRDF